ncbi:hypothetical protein OHU11_38945 [Streptomyces sp. NBC_00257]|uniref:hypothetical protein n=1 Tax=Streptomyces TaxID=1883 RepID=UPI002253A5C7|nr:MULTISPECIES: hypothetical protein [unclassified Streptomyces]MCX5433617.1 hypothetical protein [Streptomyces sp. NBC_00062]WSW09729.1 hypothetical protein OG298_38145 [Streptomyces sp. NBC_01005]WTC99237.1 hypothetical protein OH736_38160 [Streptomyces sp. NBC_01650]
MTAVEPGLSPAAVTTHHVAGGSEEFFEQVKRCYERWDPAARPRHRALALAPLNGLLGPVRGLTDDRPAGRVAKRYPHELLTVRKAL